MSSPERPPDWDAPVTLPDVDTTFERILVPFDGSRYAERALAYAAGLALRAEAEIVVVVAFDPPITMRRRAALVVADTRSDMEAEATELAEESVTALVARGCRARGVVTRGDIVDGILEAIDDERADIVILGRRGLTAEVRESRPIVGGLTHRIQGSVADKIVRHAEVPVLVV